VEGDAPGIPAILDFALGRNAREVYTVPPVTRGRLVTIEGIDGAGKSTLAEALAREIALRGVAVELLREPGGVVVSERLRELVKDATLEIGPRTETLLYAAARAQLVHERLTPLRAEGTLVLLDRFVDSSLAYQGAGRGMGVEEVRAINLFATGGLTPDRTLLLRIAPAAGHARQQVRGGASDRLERESEDFFATIAAAYEELAQEQPERIRPIDATQSRERVLHEALRAIEDLLVAPSPSPEQRPRG
jgi:dTMP kinase